ncbi:cytochrome oxidase assembly [Trichoderma cornu-damae]|uniref:Cytochrome oxidase assembly n=1 Tax=Trichoderma cornu-damae TaxID=654480 RepID=A0A9P8QRX3_9HYPO|nr:cytochrome oxidase assembly [Trichoderma cornu-damae]
MISRVAGRGLLAAASRRASGRSGANPGAAMQRRWMTPAPKQGDGPLMSRRADRELPANKWTDVGQVSHGWRRTFPIFVVVVAACSVAIFNYQKASSPIISSTLYALRTSPKAYELLGDEIYFKRQIPWISGGMNQMKGRIDISFSVRGSKAAGVMRFASRRPSSKALFETTAWSLTLEDGRVVDLLDGADPFRGLLGDDDGDDGLPLFADEAQAKGFRQQGAYNR